MIQTESDEAARNGEVPALRQIMQNFAAPCSKVEIAGYDTLPDEFWRKWATQLPDHPVPIGMLC